MGLGEAPSGIVDAAFSNFPEAYSNSLLVSIWEENSIVSVPLIPGENRIYGEPKILFKGGNDFHPVAFAINSKGDVFFTDWVKREYPNHGYGRIWKISGKQKNTSRVIEDFSGKGFLQRTEELGNEEEIINQLLVNDPFDQAVARDQLAKVISGEKLISMLEDQNQALQLQALLMLKKTDLQIPASVLTSLLHQNNPDLLRMTLIYIATKGRVDLKGELEILLRQNQIPPYLFPTFLSTISHLDPEYIQKYVSQEEPNSRSLKRNLPEDYVLNLIKDPSIPIAIKNIAIPFIDQPSQHIPELIELFQSESMEVKTGLVKIFKRIPNMEAEKLMVGLVEDESAPEEIRCESIIALSFHGNSYCQVMLRLLADDSELIQEAALNYLVNCENDPELLDKVGIAVEKNERLKKIWENRKGKNPWDIKNQEQLAKEVVFGDPVRGKMIFGLQKSQCTNCHQVDGWGGSLGPDLSNIGSSKNSDLLISAIMSPSAEISPEWQGWYLTTEDGKKVYGRQIDVGFNEVEIMNLNGEFESFKNVSDFGPSDSSLMPENLVDHLTKEEFIDLVAYLKTLK
ncbi:hypothetical protein V8V91_05960 [Algoriphagus halophilus]|uniref:hypothetical protein n=1 Tax=Algoriphagus halophilus TaxID=226505 RepID=UPI00358E5DA1